MRRVVLLLVVPVLLVAVLLVAGLAQAQVAAPDLTPAAPRFVQFDVQGFNGATITPDNPAALQWGGPTRFAIGTLQEDEEAAPAPTQSYKGNYGGLRWVSDRWAFGLEHLSVKHETTSDKESASSGHLSFQVLEGLALGAGLDRTKVDSGTNSRNTEANTFGLSVNLKKVFFLGYAIGRDKFEDNSGVSGDRDTTLIGIAIRTEGTWRWHLAWDQLDKDNFDNFGGSGFDAKTLTVQLGAGNWLLGAQQITLDAKGNAIEVKANVVDFGWAPEKGGLTVTARLTDGDLSSGGMVVQTNKGRSITIGYLF